MSVSRLTTWNTGDILTATALNAEFNQMATNIAQIASQSDMDTATNTTKALAPYLNRISQGTQVASTSGTSIDFTGIPSGTRRICIHFSGVSTSGTSNIAIQWGDSGGIETTGYLGAVTTIATATPSSANATGSAAVTNAIAAASVIHGTVTLMLMNTATFTWSLTSILGLSNAATTHYAAYVKSTSAELDRVRITTVGGSDTFDAGAINITYER